MMSLSAKHKIWVLETVDRLRQRKARPDLERISRMVERFHGLTYTETKESLDNLCEEGVVLKVHFKGNVSYRHVKKAQAETAEQSSQKYDTSSRILSAVKAIMRETGDGVGFDDLEHWLISKNPDTRLVKHRLMNALSKEIENGIITKLEDDCFVLTESLPKEKKTPERPTCIMKKTEKTVKPAEVKLKTVKPAEVKPKTVKPAEVKPKTVKPAEVKPQQEIEKVEKEKNNEKSVTKENEENSEVKESQRRGRPLSKRKKFKKTHGPDFENPLELKKAQGKEKSEEKEEEPDKCAFCSLTAAANPGGQEETLLVCKDCSAKAHPSCMDYSPELAKRALNSPWQCMDCKMCAICDGMENADLMLFCDACDKGYHMNCHQPPLVNKPKGKWVCFACKKETSKVVKNEQKDSSEKEEEGQSRRRGRKRKISSPVSPDKVKSQKSEQSGEEGTKSESNDANEQPVSDFTGDVSGTACLLTPSASPRPSDTFDYEMKMSLAGLTFPLTEDNTTYSDASDWNVHDVTSFFEGCGFTEEARTLAEQEIDGKSLLLMRREDVTSGLGLRLGPAVKIYKKIVRLQQYSQAALFS